MIINRQKIIAALIFFAAAASSIGLLFMPADASGLIRKKIKRQWLILSGRLVDVGGRRLRIECKGAGSPAVLLEAGLNQTVESWERLPDDIAEFTRVCVYERAGLGESDRAPETTRTSSHIVRDLKTLLEKTGERTPFILVGHSFGGINARLYARRYPREVAGLVLIDASHESQYECFASLMPRNEREEYLHHEGGGNAERIDLLSCASELARAQPLPRLPIIVLSARIEASVSENESLARAHAHMQSALAELDPDSIHIVVTRSGHFIQLDRPDAVRLVIESMYRSLEK